MELKYYLSLLIFLYLSFSANAQNKYYQIVHIDTETGDNTEIKEYYDSREVRARNKDIIAADKDFVLFFENSGVYKIGDAEEFGFNKVVLFESKSKRYFEKKNWKIDPPFQLSDRDFLNKEKIDLIETGKTKIINSKLCHEYIIEGRRRRTYFIDKNLPFIHYKPFLFKFPGFVTSYTSYVHGSSDPITITKQLLEINCDDKYFKYIDEFRKTFTPISFFDKETFLYQDTIPKYIIDNVNESYLDNYYYEHEIAEIKRDRSLSIKHKVKRSNLKTYTSVYFDSSQNEILKLKRKNNSLEKDATRSPEIIGDTILYEYSKFSSVDKVSKELIIHNYNQTREYNFVGLGSKSVINVNDKNQPILVKSFDEKGDLRGETTYTYNEKDQLAFVIVNKDALDTTRTYQYHPNGLLSQIIKYGDTINFEYIFKPGKATDTLFQKEKRSSSFTISINEAVFNKHGQILLDKKTGEYSRHNQLFYGYNEEKRLPKPLLQLESLLRKKYLNAYVSTFQILSKRNKPNEKINNIENITKHQFAFLDLFKQQIEKPRKTVTNWFPEFELNEIELFHEDNDLEYYKAYYSEVINCAVDRTRLDYEQTLNTFQSKYGRKQVKANTDKSSIILDLSTRYLIIKKDKSNNQWVIEL